MASFPPDLDLDDTDLARGLSPPSPVAARRRAVQSLCLRAQMHHVRFTLHRPFTTPQIRQAVGPHSFDTAVSAADKLIQLINQARPEYLVNTSLVCSRSLSSKHSVDLIFPSQLNPGHVFWGGYHMFAAAIFLAFQLILQPDQPGTALFRADIQRAMSVLENLAGGISVAAKALKILQALVPLYEGTPLDENQRGSHIAVVRRLAFPCHDSPVYPRPMMTGDSPANPSHSPTNSMSPGGVLNGTPSGPHAVLPPPSHLHAQYYELAPYPVNSSAEALWSSCLGLDSSEWGAFLSSLYVILSDFPVLL
jgi:hypothetical protein